MLPAASVRDFLAAALTSFTGDGAYDQAGVYDSVAGHHPEAAVIIPPRSTAVPSDTAETKPTRRDCHLQCIAEHSRMDGRSGQGTIDAPKLRLPLPGGNG